MMVISRFGKGSMHAAEFTEEIMVIGLFTYYKWDQASVWEYQNGGKTIPADELERFQLSEKRLNEIQETIKRDLKSYVENNRPLHQTIETVVTQTLHEQERKKPSPSFWYGVWQGLVSAFIYTIVVAGIMFGIAYNGVGLPGVEVHIESQKP